MRPKRLPPSLPVYANARTIFSKRGILQHSTPAKSERSSGAGTDVRRLGEIQPSWAGPAQPAGLTWANAST